MFVFNFCWWVKLYTMVLIEKKFDAPKSVILYYGREDMSIDVDGIILTIEKANMVV